MVDLLARVIEERHSDYRIIACGFEDIYGDIPIDEVVEYDGNNEITDNQWYFIEEFSKKNFADQELLSIDCRPDYDLITSSEKVNLLIVLSEGKKYFQLVSTRVLRKKKLVLWENGYKLLDEGAMITINSVPDAIYDEDKDTLLFNKESSIAQIFPKMEVVLRDATDAEVQEFGSNGNLEFNIKIAKIGKRNRKRVLKNKEFAANLKNKEYISYIKEYRPELIKKGKIQINSDRDLSNVLDGLEKRYYTEKIGSKKMIASSRRRM